MTLYSSEILYYWVQTFGLSMAACKVLNWNKCQVHTVFVLTFFFLFHVPGQKSHYQNYEDVHGEVCHGEFSVRYHLFIHSSAKTSCPFLISSLILEKIRIWMGIIYEVESTDPRVNVWSTGGVWSPGSSGHVRLCGRHQAGQTGRALSESDVMWFKNIQWDLKSKNEYDVELKNVKMSGDDHHFEDVWNVDVTVLNSGLAWFPPVQEILTSLEEVISNKYGKKVLLYLLSPRDPAHLLPEIIKVLEQGDKNAHR